MYYKDTGFRALYKHFIAFPLKDNIKQCIENYPNAEKANCVLTYGYVDHDAGLTMEVLAAGFKDGDGFTFFDTSVETRAFIRVGAVIDDEFFFFDDADGGLSEKYAEKLDVLKHYEVSEEIEETRKMGFLDKSRHDFYPDDVMVYLTREGLDPEGCWVRIIGLGDHFIMGTLLNDPDQDFGYHSGEKVAFFVQKQEDESVGCCRRTSVRSAVVKFSSLMLARSSTSSARLSVTRKTRSVPKTVLRSRSCMQTLLRTSIAISIRIRSLSIVSIQSCSLCREAML